MVKFWESLLCSSYAAAHGRIRTVAHTCGFRFAVICVVLLLATSHEAAAARRNADFSEAGRALGYDNGNINGAGGSIYGGSPPGLDKPRPPSPALSQQRSVSSPMLRTASAPTAPPTNVTNPTNATNSTNPPSDYLSEMPSLAPTGIPVDSTASPTDVPSGKPRTLRSAAPSVTASQHPSELGSQSPTVGPSPAPSLAAPSSKPTYVTVGPTSAPTSQPSDKFVHPSQAPSDDHSNVPTHFPFPSVSPTSTHTSHPSLSPSRRPSVAPVATTQSPSEPHTGGPTAAATAFPSQAHTGGPTAAATTASPSAAHTGGPTAARTVSPSAAHTSGPSATATISPTFSPTSGPSANPTTPLWFGTTDAPTTVLRPSSRPTEQPTVPSTTAPTAVPTDGGVRTLTLSPGLLPGSSPTLAPAGGFVPTFDWNDDIFGFPVLAFPSDTTLSPSVDIDTNQNSLTPRPNPRPTGTPRPNPRPTETPDTPSPTPSPTKAPTPSPTAPPTDTPTRQPSKSPTRQPVVQATPDPTDSPSPQPTSNPTTIPTRNPTRSPTNPPTRRPTDRPTTKPTLNPTRAPSKVPTLGPTRVKSQDPTPSGTLEPSPTPTHKPTTTPTVSPAPSIPPSPLPTTPPTERPTRQPSIEPSSQPSLPKQTARVEAIMSISPRTNRLGGSGVLNWEQVTEMHLRDHLNSEDIDPPLLELEISPKIVDQSLISAAPAVRRLQEVNQVDQLVISFDVNIEFKSTGSGYDFEAFVFGAWNEPPEREDYVAELREASPEFQGVGGVLVEVKGFEPAPVKGVVTQEDSKPNIALIAGASVGGAALVLLVAFLLVRRKTEKEYDDNNEQSRTTPDTAPKIAVSTEILVEPQDDISTLGDPMFAPGGMLIGGLEKDEVTASVGDDYDYARQYRHGRNPPSVGGSTTRDRERLMSEDFTKTSSANSTTMSKLNRMGESLFADDASFEQQFAEPEERFDVVAPAGKLGMVIDTPNGGLPVVHAIKDTSVLADRVRVGDRLLSVDGEDCTAMTAMQVSKLISLKSEKPARVLVFARSRANATDEA